MNATVYQAKIQEAVSSSSRDLVIVARAGCGKTTTALNCVLPLFKARTDVFFGCFGKRIADENKGKLALKRDIQANVDCSTFHSLGMRLVTAHWGRVRLSNWREEDLAKRLFQDKDSFKFSIKAIGQIAQKFKEISPLGSREDMEEIADRFDLISSGAEKEGLDPEDLFDSVERVLEDSKKKDGTISFADMIWLPIVNGFAKPKFGVIIVDECQDLNASQILLAQMCLKPGGRTIVIGDPRQAIFGFRGADSKSIDRLKEELPDHIELALPQTFRCGKAIVRLAQEIVEDFVAFEGNHEGEVLDANRDEIYAKAKPGDAILSRKNAPLVGICLRLLRDEKKAYIEGKDIGINLCNIVDAITKKRPSPILGFLEDLQEYGQDQEKRLMGKRGGEQLVADSWDKIECLEVLSDGLVGTNELKKRIQDLFADPDRIGRRGKIVLSSIHKAKGLEFDRVWGLWDTLSDRNEEEENLRYVLITRAINTLVRVHNPE